MITPEVWFSIFLGFLVALWFEKYYVSRVTVLPNVIVIFFLMWPDWKLVNVYVKWYILIGILLGIIALGLRIKERKVPGWIYDSTYPFYCGKTLMPIYSCIILFKEYLPTQIYLTSFWITTTILLIITWFVGVKYLNNNYPFEPFFS